MLTPADELLLIRTAVPHLPTALWLTPGGGVEVGEGVRDALRRELAEATGLQDAGIGPEVWARCHSYRWGARHVTQAERYFVVRTPRFHPHAQGLRDSQERRDVVGYRWWRLDEIAASEERFVPMRLPLHLRSLLDDGPPVRPIDVGG